MVHGKNRCPYWIDRRLTGLAGSHDDATTSLGLPIEPEDSQYGKYRLIRRAYRAMAGARGRIGGNILPGGRIIRILHNSHTGALKRVGNATAAVLAVVSCVSMASCVGESSNGDAYTPTQVTSTGPSNRVPTADRVSNDDDDGSAPRPTPVPVGPRPTGPDTVRPFHECDLLGRSGPSSTPHRRRPRHFIDWTPDGSAIIFDDRTAVMMVDADGSRLRAIVDANPGFDLMHGFHADLSPDGSHIVYSSCQYPTDGSYQMYQHSELGWRRFPLEGRERYFYEIASVAIDGSERRRLTEDKYLDDYPSWSPDGTRIAFMRSPYVGYTGQLHIMLASGEQHGLTRPFPAELLPLPLGDLVRTATAWSPNGERLAVVARGDWEDRLIVYTVRADGSGFQSVSDTVSVPSWSPDGSRLALARYHGKYARLVTVAPDGSNPRIVATISERGIHVGVASAGLIRTLAWSSDGTHIMSTCDVGLCVFNLQGDLVGEAPIEANPPPGSEFVVMGLPAGGVVTGRLEDRRAHPQRPSTGARR